MKKKESYYIQSVCVNCNFNLQQSSGKKNGKNIYKALCTTCNRRKHNIIKKEYTVYKKKICQKCGFVPEHPCQLDVDHIDGNHYNNDLKNLQTLCANCHRLKSYKNRDWC